MQPDIFMQATSDSLDLSLAPPLPAEQRLQPVLSAMLADGFSPGTAGRLPGLLKQQL